MRVGGLASWLGIVGVLAVGTAHAALVAKQIGAGDTALLFGGADAEGGVGDWYLSNGVVQAIVDDAGPVADLVGVVPSDSEMIPEFERQVSALPDVLECHHVTGAFTLLLKVKTANTSTLERLIAQIRSMDGVARTETTVVLSTHVARVQRGLQPSPADTVPPNHTRRSRRASGASGDSSGHLRRA